MQNAKDTFYITLRDRIATINPARTVLVRGQSRPGVLVEENELASAFDQHDAFRLRWTTTNIDSRGSLPLVTMRCEIHYATAGNSGNGGMDRGRLLTAMDAELAAAINAIPQRTAKNRYSAAGPTATTTNIFWNDVTFASTEVEGELLRRTATVDVYSYQEAGEL
ncbi:hypothetical protein [Edaphobacter flagellatus]|uniref:hypothetical protein n=1 Tax=Edaphobacter flagellatus TaxID=1933044 RepID=UPI0021B1AEDA|nr:hypothetical protein [Edaphobacter flagellatus]